MANSDKNIKITPSRNKSTFPNIVFTGSSAGTSVITLNVLDDNVLSFESNEGQVFSLDSNLTSGAIWGVSDVSGVPLLRASVGGTIGLGEYYGLVGIGTDNPIHKFQVRGTAAFASTNDGLLTFIIDNSQSAGSANIQARRGNTLRFYASGDSFYTALKGSATSTYTLTLPTAVPSAIGVSYLTVDTTGQMSYQAAVNKRFHRIQFAAGLNPSAGADSAVYEIPFSYADGTTSVTYRMRRAHVRVETASATGSSFRIEKYAYSGGTGVSLFSTTSTGSTTNILAAPLIIGGATTYEASTTTFAGTHITAVSGDKLRLNFLAASASQFSFSISLIMEQDL